MPQFKLPDPGEGLVEAEIVTWKVKEGDQVTTNDIVVEVETAKSLVELPIPYDGTVRALLAAEGDTVEVGTPIIDIDDGSDEAGAEPAGASDPAQKKPAEKAAEKADAPKREAILVGYGASEGSTARRRRKSTALPAESEPEPEPVVVKSKAKPPVRKYAKQQGVDINEVTATREDGVIMRSDVDAFLAGGAKAGDAEAGADEAQPKVAPARPAAPAIGRSDGERETRTPVKGVRKMTANAMVASAFTAPHVTEFITIDATATMELVERLKSDREFRDIKVSPLLVLAKAMTVALKRNPGVNAVWDEQAQEIVQRHYVNLGIAAATPRGLIVPNIKDADQMNLREMADALGELISTAKSGRTQPADMSGGTITITNVGVFGIDTGTPIINPGESAIVCFGAIRKQPWVVTNAAGEEEIVPRWITQLSMSFDHRLIDGELGSKFLADLAALMSDPSRALVWG
ncbi:2-oxo acid dehydrogenase subunit E2 [Ornithinimicrobium sp. Arc0846-15]|nr:2-oxo acid dehydrogenase subunit E2 [Ornithinimicrobium laminariae]